MNPTIVTTQSEMDAAVSSGAEWIRVDSSPGVWIEVTSPAATEVEAYDSATVTAFGSATVTAYDSASVTAYGSASVRAYDSASVTAYDSASVTAYDSASVRAYDSASVRAYDSASVRAGSGVAVHLHSGSARIQGGVLIDHTAVDLTDVSTWLDYKGITVTDGIATFYKAVDGQLRAGHGYKMTAYPIGETVTAPDWDPAERCGHGLHATGDPGLSESYYNGDGPCRYLELAVPVDGLVLLGDKVKFRSCRVVREVTLFGAPLAGAR